MAISPSPRQPLSGRLRVEANPIVDDLEANLRRAAAQLRRDVLRARVLHCVLHGFL